jgi:hypothetical protein
VEYLHKDAGNDFPHFSHPKSTGLRPAAGAAGLGEEEREKEEEREPQRGSRPTAAAPGGVAR